MPSSGGPDSRWSQTQTESRPTASACWPKVRTCGQVGTWPGPSDTAMGRTTPIRMPASLGSRVLLATQDLRRSGGLVRAGCSTRARRRPARRRRTARRPDPSAPAGAANSQATTATARCASGGAQPLQGFDPATREVIPRRRSAARLVRLSCALSAWSLSGRWRRCPEGVRTAGRRRPSLRATSRRRQRGSGLHRRPRTRRPLH